MRSRKEIEDRYWHLHTYLFNEYDFSPGTVDRDVIEWAVLDILAWVLQFNKYSRRKK